MFLNRLPRRLIDIRDRNCLTDVAFRKVSLTTMGVRQEQHQASRRQHSQDRTVRSGYPENLDIPKRQPVRTGPERVHSPANLAAGNRRSPQISGCNDLF